ncbi:MAG TPA: serine hydrolase domain-containing protein, partial [Gemmatimonadaceae bacterium]|nr:serine hydrolase domain-containing protein [Gemmatimonadaceae bacterium]
ITKDAIATTGFGVTRAGGGAPVTADTVFEAASLSKPVFAYLVHTLAAEGKLDLARPLSTYLALPNPADAASAPITARHVLSHTSGWRNWRFAKNDQLTADFAPGSKFSYSGEGYYFLQRVVEKVTGTGILRLTRERVFEPLGMKNSGYLWFPALDGSRAEPHSGRGVPIDSFNVKTSRLMRDAAAAANQNVDDWKHDDFERTFAAANKELAPFPNFLAPNVAGSLLTTANDYAKFVSHLLGAGSKGGGSSIFQRMTDPQVTINKSLKWGLGVGLEMQELGKPATRPLAWHWGDNQGFKNFFVADPNTSTAVVVFANGNRGQPVYERIVRKLRGNDQPAFLWL